MANKAAKRDENGNKVNTQGAKESHSDEDVIKSLWAHKGNITETAKDLGYAPSYLRHRVESTPDIYAEYKEIRNAYIERAIDSLYKELEKPVTKKWVQDRILDSEAAKSFGFGKVNSYKVDAENTNINTSADIDLNNLTMEEKLEYEQLLRKASKTGNNTNSD